MINIGRRRNRNNRRRRRDRRARITQNLRNNIRERTQPNTLKELINFTSKHSFQAKLMNLNENAIMRLVESEISRRRSYPSFLLDFEEEFLPDDNEGANNSIIESDNLENFKENSLLKNFVLENLGGNDTNFQIDSRDDVVFKEIYKDWNLRNIEEKFEERNEKIFEIEVEEDEDNDEYFVNCLKSEFDERYYKDFYENLAKFENYEKRDFLIRIMAYSKIVLCDYFELKIRDFFLENFEEVFSQFIAFFDKENDNRKFNNQYLMENLIDIILQIFEYSLRKNFSIKEISKIFFKQKFYRILELGLKRQNWYDKEKFCSVLTLIDLLQKSEIFVNVLKKIETNRNRNNILPMRFKSLNFFMNRDKDFVEFNKKILVLLITKEKKFSKSKNTIEELIGLESEENEDIRNFKLESEFYFLIFQIFLNFSFIVKFKGEKKLKEDSNPDRFRGINREIGNKNIPYYRKLNFPDLKKNEKISKKRLKKLISMIEIKPKRPTLTIDFGFSSQIKRIKSLLMNFLDLDFKTLSVEEQYRFLTHSTLDQERLKYVNMNSVKPETFLKMLKNDIMISKYFSSLGFENSRIFFLIFNIEKFYQEFIDILMEKIHDEFYELENLVFMIPNFISLIKGMTNRFFDDIIDLGKMKKNDFLPFKKNPFYEEENEIETEEEDPKRIDIEKIGQLYEFQGDKNFLKKLLKIEKFEELKNFIFEVTEPFVLRMRRNVKNLTRGDDNLDDELGEFRIGGRAQRPETFYELRLSTKFPSKFKIEQKNSKLKKSVNITKKNEFYQKKINPRDSYHLRRGSGILKKSEQVEDPERFRFHDVVNPEENKKFIIIKSNSNFVSNNSRFSRTYQRIITDSYRLVQRRDPILRFGIKNSIEFVMDQRNKKVLLKIDLRKLKDKISKNLVQKKITNFDSEDERNLDDLRVSHTDYEASENPNITNVKLGLTDQIIRNKIYLKPKSLKVYQALNFTRRTLEDIRRKCHSKDSMYNYCGFTKESVRFSNGEYSYVYKKGKSQPEISTSVKTEFGYLNSGIVGYRETDKKNFNHSLKSLSLPNKLSIQIQGYFNDAEGGFYLDSEPGKHFIVFEKLVVRKFSFEGFGEEKSFFWEIPDGVKVYFGEFRSLAYVVDLRDGVNVRVLDLIRLRDELEGIVVKEDG